MNEVKPIPEDQPLPPPDAGASPEANARFQEKVNEFGKILVRRLQMSGGQLNILELEVRVFILVEQVNLLTELVKKMSNGVHTDETLTDAMTVNMTRLCKQLTEVLDSAPRLAIAGGAIPPRMNGSKHN